MAEKLFICYVATRTRKLIVTRDMPVDRAIDFIKETGSQSLVEDSDGEVYTQEELENVKSFGSKDRTEFDKHIDPVGEIPEDSYRELFGTLGHNAESSTERNN